MVAAGTAASAPAAPEAAAAPQRTAAVAQALSRLQQAISRSYHDGLNSGVPAKKKTTMAKLLAGIPDGPGIQAGIEEYVATKGIALLLGSDQPSSAEGWFSSEAAENWVPEVQRRLCALLQQAWQLRMFIGAASPDLGLMVSPRFSAFSGTSHEAMRDLGAPQGTGYGAAPAAPARVVLCCQPGLRYVGGSAAAAGTAGGGVIKREEVIAMHLG